MKLNQPILIKTPKRSGSVTTDKSHLDGKFAVVTEIINPLMVKVWIPELNMFDIMLSLNELEIIDSIPSHINVMTPKQYNEHLRLSEKPTE